MKTKFDFAQLEQDLRPKTKKIMLEGLNSLQEDESTRNVNDKEKEKKQETKPEVKEIPFLSLRQRYGSVLESDNYPLPQKFDALLTTMKSIEQNFWKKKKGVSFDFTKHCFEIIQIGQLLKLDKELYQITRTDKGIDVKIPVQTQENLPDFKYYEQMPAELQKRINRIRGKLDLLVQEKHTLFLEENSYEDYLDFSKKFKIYHPLFDLNSVDEIIPLAITEKVFGQEERDQFKQLIEQLLSYYTVRGVNHMYFQNLIKQMELRMEIGTEELDSKLIILIKCLPDFIKVTNKFKEPIRTKWIIQVNKQCKLEDIMDQLNLYFF